jgi:predicted anti-sigma-YlaC factor YlaD
MLTSGHSTECFQARGAVSARLDGPLSELDAVRLDAHLEACADCRAYAAEIGAFSALLRAAPLEQPNRPMFVPTVRKRRPLVRVQLAAAAVVLLAAATASSFALGRAIGGHSSPAATATSSRPTDAVSVRADSTRQHLLAMSGRVPNDGSMRVGKAVAL